MERRRTEGKESICVIPIFGDKTRKEEGTIYRGSVGRFVRFACLATGLFWYENKPLLFAPTLRIRMNLDLYWTEES